MTGVGSIFAQLKAEAAAKEEKRIEAGGEEEEEGEGEEGEEGEVKGEKGVKGGFTLCEEEKRKIRKEERQKRKEEGKKGEANCE